MIDTIRKSLVLACLLLFTAACGGGGGGGHATPQLSCSGVGASATDRVRFDCPASSGSPIAVRVMIGPTISTDIYLIKFDVVFDPAVLNFDPPAIEGNFLDQGGIGTVFEAAEQPGDPGRLVVSVSRIGAVGGVGVGSGEKTVITLPFLGMGSGSTALTFENAEAVDSSAAPVAGIQFSGPVDVDVP